MVPIPRRIIELSLKQLVPFACEVAGLFAENAEENGLPPRMNRWIKIYGIKGWARSYLNVEHLFEAHTDGLAGINPEKLSEFSIDWSNVDQSNPEAIYRAIWEWFEKILLSDLLEPDLPESFEEEERILLAMPVAEKDAHIEKMRCLISAALVIVNNYHACMTYKKSMVQLVSEAMKGNRKSFLQAVHVDQSCLEDIDYFRETLIKAATSANDNFVSKVQKWRQKPPLSSGVSLSGLYMAFMVLNLLGVLEQFKSDMERFAHLCQSLGIYGPPAADEAVDVESFAKALRRFESEHEAIHFVSPGKLVVKDSL